MEISFADHKKIVCVCVCIDMLSNRKQFMSEMKRNKIFACTCQCLFEHEILYVLSQNIEKSSDFEFWDEDYG